MDMVGRAAAGWIALVAVAGAARADLSGGPSSVAAAAAPLAISARHVGQRRFRIRLTNRSARPVKLLFAWRDKPMTSSRNQRLPESPFSLSFDLHPPQSLPIMPPPGPAVRWLGPGRSIEFVTGSLPLVGNEYQPRAVYDSGVYLGSHCEASDAPCYLTSEQCPDCLVTSAESSILDGDWQTR
jgi:hypothetical protein